jgi:hypothetical protein
VHRSLGRTVASRYRLSKRTRPEHAILGLHCNLDRGYFASEGKHDWLVTDSPDLFLEDLGCPY